MSETYPRTKTGGVLDECQLSTQPYHRFWAQEECSSLDSQVAAEQLQEHQNCFKSKTYARIAQGNIAISNAIPYPERFLPQNLIWFPVLNTALSGETND